jgi:hypothetical protein
MIKKLIEEMIPKSSPPTPKAFNPFVIKFLKLTDNPIAVIAIKMRRLLDCPKNWVNEIGRMWRLLIKPARIKSRT